MLELVKVDYEGQSISFSEDGWFNATAAADRFGKRHSIYCILFTHGLMKVGSTDNFHKRLKAICSHGLLKPLVSRVIMKACLPNNMLKAERLALKLFKVVARQYSDEVFYSIHRCVARSILRYAVASIDCPKRKAITEDDYSELMPMPVLCAIARERRVTQSLHEAVNFVLHNEGRSELKWTRGLDRLHPLTAELIPRITYKNALLILRGATYQERKAELENFTEEQRIRFIESKSTAEQTSGTLGA